MKALPRFVDWPLRVKIAILIVLASLLPLAIAAIKDIHESRRNLISTTEALLSARADQLVGEMDTFHRGYQRSAAKSARLPDIAAFCGAIGAVAERLKPAVVATLSVQSATDPNIRGVAILGTSGTGKAAPGGGLAGGGVCVPPFSA